MIPDVIYSFKIKKKLRLACYINHILYNTIMRIDSYYYCKYFFMLCFGFIFLIIFHPITSIIESRHPHNGIIKPFTSVGDLKIKLDSNALSILKLGLSYKTTQIIAQNDNNSDNSVNILIQDIYAPVDIVWERILDFNHYNEMVPKTYESSIYKTIQLDDDTNKQQIYVRMKVGFPLLKLQYYMNHIYDPIHNSLTWTLDYSMKSDLNDSVGYWYVIPHPDNPTEWSRVYYSVQVSMFSWVPQFMVDFMSQQALVDATAWVKKYSELEVTSKQDKRQSKSPVNWFQNTEGISSETTTPINSSEKSSIQRNNKVGLKRYALIFIIVALSLYNIHLYFSQ